jgi:hypothetical protein
MAQGTFHQMSYNGEKYMTPSRFSNGADTSVGHDLFDAARYYLSGRRGVLVFIIIAALAGIGLSWNWLIAAGIAPLLLTALPCLVMCGSGLCMNNMLGSSCASETTQAKTAELSLGIGNQHREHQRCIAIRGPPALIPVQMQCR